MRILHVINSLSGSGGAEHGFVREIARFPDTDIQLVLYLYEHDDLGDQLRSAGIETLSLELESANSGTNWLAAARRVAGHVEEFAPDVMQSSLFSGNLAAQLATRRTKVPLLSTFTLSGDPRLLREFQPGADSWKAWLVRRVGAFAAQADSVSFRAIGRDTMLTNCELLRVSQSRCRVIPRGVALPDLDAHAPTLSELGLDPSRPMVLNVGRQAAQKGHPHLVRAFASVINEFDAQLVILGRTGDGSKALETAIQNESVGPLVTTIPYVENPNDYYLNASVFGFSSLMEGLGTAVLEAMAAGIPVVGFDIPQLREITDDGRVATLVPVGDESAFADALKFFLRDRVAAAEMGSAARSWVGERYSVDRTAREVRELLARLAAG